MTIEWKRNPHYPDVLDDYVADVGPVQINMWESAAERWAISIGFDPNYIAGLPTRAAAEAKAEEILAALRGALGEGNKP